jgi:hypothetical protein
MVSRDLTTKKEGDVFMQSHTLNTLRRGVAPLAAFVMVLSTAWVVFAHAQTQGTASQQPPTTTPEALFQDSTLTSTTNTINATWLPVVTADGTILYDDVTVQFAVAADGTLSVSGLQQNLSPRAIIDHFKAGNYIAIGHGNPPYLITIAGPSLAPGGATDWSLSVSPGGNGCSVPYNATWWVGPIMKSPYWPRIKAAGVPLQNYSYGVGGTSNCNGDWNPNSLLGFTQINGVLAITSFTVNGTDQPQPVAEIPYTYCNGKNGCKQGK